MLDPVAASERVRRLPSRTLLVTVTTGTGCYDELLHGDMKKGLQKRIRWSNSPIKRTANTWVGPERPCGVWKWNATTPRYG